MQTVSRISDISQPIPAHLGTPSEIKTGLSGKNSHVGRPPRPPPPVWEFFRRNTIFFWRCPKVKKLNKLQKLEDALIEQMLIAADLADRGDRGELGELGEFDELGELY